MDTENIDSRQRGIRTLIKPALMLIYIKILIFRFRHSVLAGIIGRKPGE